jgi:Bacterial pre-peptidase C-terminal domain
VLAPGNVTEVITFSKPIQPSSVSTSDISLLGEIRGDDYTPTISFDPTDTILTVNYTNLPTDAYQFTLLAGPANFLSLAGVPLQDSYVVNFTIPGGTSTISGLQPVLPLGSLVYQSRVDNVLLSSTDIDTYNLAIDPQQTLAVLVTPVTSSLSATVELISPAGKVIGKATSPGPGEAALLPAVQSSKGGAYQILVFGGVGEYKVQATLNALIDPASYGGASNGSIASATPIDPFSNEFVGNDTRTAVLGSIGGSPATFGDSLVVTASDVILGEAPFPAPNDPVYSFALNQGQSASIALEGLNDSNVSFTLYDDLGDVLGLSSPGATNYTAGLNDFVAPNDGTYYVQVSGDPSAQFNPVVTRGADFTTQDHTSPGDAQDITATQQSGDPKEGGALGYISTGPIRST